MLSVCHTGADSVVCVSYRCRRCCLSIIQVQTVLSVCYTGADSVVYLSLEGLVKAVKEGGCDTLMEPSDHSIAVDSAVPQDVRGIKLNVEECSAGAACNGNMTTLQQRGHDGCTNTSQNGYCVACLSGDYPDTLDW